MTKQRKRPIPKIPSSIGVTIGPARRMYIQRLLARGLFGNTPAEVVDIVFCRGLQQVVPPEWFREVLEMKRQR